MINFATYLHPHTCYTSKPSNLLKFAGYSFPHYNRVRQELEKALVEYPSLNVRKVELTEYLQVHAQEYLRQLTLMASEQPLDKKPKLSIECKNLEHCLPGYCYGLGGMIEAIDQMKQGKLERAYCFSLVGHHAYSDWGHGYCLLNPLAAAAKYSQTQGFKNILIVDWDIHHGDGTQSIFSNNPSIYCISIHSVVDLYMAKTSGLQPGTTAVAEEVGQCNIPILHERFKDNFFERVGLKGKFYRGHESLSIFQSELEKLPWNPDLIMIFSGYDSHRDDCGKGVTGWTNLEFRLLTEMVLELARKASCPVLSTHGGGYNLPVTVKAAVNHVEVLATYR